MAAVVVCCVLLALSRSAVAISDTQISETLGKAYENLNGFKTAEASGTYENTYGETRVDTILKLMNDIGVKSGSTYYDLGSGIGKNVVAAAMQLELRATGFELDDGRHNQACAALVKLKGEPGNMLMPATVHPNIEFRKENIFEISFRDADVISAIVLKANGGFAEKLAKSLKDSMKEGAIYFGVVKLPEDFIKGWLEPLRGEAWEMRSYSFAFGSLPVYVYQRLSKREIDNRERKEKEEKEAIANKEKEEKKKKEREEKDEEERRRKQEAREKEEEEREKEKERREEQTRKEKEEKDKKREQEKEKERERELSKLGSSIGDSISDKFRDIKSGMGSSSSPSSSSPSFSSSSSYSTSPSSSSGWEDWKSKYTGSSRSSSSTSSSFSAPSSFSSSSSSSSWSSGAADLWKKYGGNKGAARALQEAAVSFLESEKLVEDHFLQLSGGGDQSAGAYMDKMLSQIKSMDSKGNATKIRDMLDTPRDFGKMCSARF